MSVTSVATKPRTSADRTVAFSAGVIEEAPGSAVEPPVAPPTSPEVELAEAEPAPLTLTDKAGPVAPAPAPAFEPPDPDDPP